MVWKASGRAEVTGRSRSSVRFGRHTLLIICISSSVVEVTELSVTSVKTTLL